MRQEPTMSPSLVRLRRFFPLWSVRFCSEMPLQMLWSSPRIEGKCEPLPGGVANTAQRKMLRKEEKGRREFPFLLPPCRLFIYLAYLYVHLDSPPPSGCLDRVGWHTSHPTSLKGGVDTGVIVQKLIYATKGLIYERDCGLCAAACGLCITQVCTHSMQSDKWWRWNIFWQI